VGVTSEPLALSTTESFLKSINEKDNGQSTDNIYILAKRQLGSNEPVNLEVINKYLAHFSLSITKEEFDILLSIRKVEFELPLNKSSELLLDSIGRNLNKNHKDSINNRFAGVYIFTNKINGEQYVGSSIDLASRVRYYFKPSVRSTENRLIIQSLNKYEIENFTLSIYKIDPKLNLNL